MPSQYQDSSSRCYQSDDSAKEGGRLKRFNKSAAGDGDQSCPDLIGQSFSHGKRASQRVTCDSRRFRWQVAVELWNVYSINARARDLALRRLEDPSFWRRLLEMDLLVEPEASRAAEEPSELTTRQDISLEFIWFE